MLVIHLKKQRAFSGRERKKEEDKWRKIKKKSCITSEETHCPSRTGQLECLLFLFNPDGESNLIVTVLRLSVIRKHQEGSACYA